jgi:hypothetical protein
MPNVQPHGQEANDRQHDRLRLWSLLDGLVRPALYDESWVPFVRLLLLLVVVASVVTVSRQVTGIEWVTEMKRLL